MERGERLLCPALRCQKFAEMGGWEGLPLAAASCKERAEMRRGETMMLAAMKCPQNTEMGGWEGAAVSCSEVSEIRKNGEKGGASVSFHEMQYISRIG